MSEHPIQGLMRATLDSLKEMVDVNTVVGDAVETHDGQLIIPVSRVTVGFAAGGSQFGKRDRRGRQRQDDDEEEDDYDNRSRHQDSQTQENGARLPFGGGSGAGVSVQPVGFLVVNKHEIRMLSVDHRHGWERLIDLAPQLMDRLSGRPQRGGESEDEMDPDAPDSPLNRRATVRRRARKDERAVRRVIDALGEDDDHGPYR